MGNIIQMIMNLFFGGNKKKEVKELDKAINLVTCAVVLSGDERCAF